MHDVTYCNIVQQDPNHVYDKASTNTMFYNAQQFDYITVRSKESNMYLNLELNIKNPSSEVHDLGVCLVIVIFMLQIYLKNGQQEPCLGWIMPPSHGLPTY